MRILVSSLGGAGHTYPLLPLARALAHAGHDVTVATGAETGGAVTAAGLPAVPAGIDMPAAFAAAMERRGLTERPTDAGIVGELVGEVFGDVMPRAFVADVGDWIARHHPDLVVAEVGCPGAAMAAVLAGVPCVAHSFGRRPDAGSVMGRSLSTSITALAGELGLDLPSGGRFLGHAYLDICPPSLQAPAGVTTARELPLRPTPWNPPVPAFVPRPHDGPWVYLTLGTAMGDAGVLRTAVAGLSGLGVDVVLATGSVDAGALADLADDQVQVEPFVPQAALLLSDRPPALVVHHGGSGTTLAAAAAGVPQLILPQGADQFTNADAVLAVGAGRSLVGRDAVTADAVVSAAGELLADGAAARGAARALAAEIAGMPSPAAVAARVEEWARP